MNEGISADAMQRINVIGTSGSGKSTFSKRLAAIIGAPYLEIDKMFWGPDWTSAPDDIFFSKMEKELKADKWVLDGNYTRTTPIKWQNVQTVIWLDYSFLTVLSRAIRRALWRVISRVELWEGTGNRETLKLLFSRDSIVLWTWNTYAENKIKYNQVMADERYAHIHFIRLQSPDKTEKFLEKTRALFNSNKPSY